MNYVIKIWAALCLFTLTDVCFAQTQAGNNSWTNEILVYIIFDLLFLVAVIVLVKLVCMSAKLSKYY
jgi:ABC-type multidrug transport system permease subunit